MRLITTTLAAIAFGLLTTLASAATFYVDSTADAVDATPGDGLCATATSTCTLRAAVMEANALAGADVIDLTAINDPNTPITLSLEGVDENWAAVTGGTVPCEAVITPDASIGDLDITDDVEIIGAGPANTVIEWANQSLTDPNVGDRIFHIQAPTGVTINLVRIADLMITRGSVGIPNDTDPANPYNCEVTGDPGSYRAWQFRRFGGGIAIGPGAAVALFEETTHGPGGGGGGGTGGGPGGDEGGETAGTVSAVEINQVAVINNQSGSDAGGIIAAAPLTMTGSVISGNLSSANGGALYIDGATLISGSLLGSSSTDVPFASGSLAAALVANGNTAENGGAIFATGANSSLIEASAINGNSAIGGGGIASRSIVALTLINTTVNGNVGTDVGGGITTNGTINLRNVTLADNESSTDATGGGAGLNSFGSGNYNFYNTILSNNVIHAGSGDREANCGCSGGTAQCPPGTMVSTGYNINDEATDTCSLDVALHDQPNTDPLLKPLTNNGGLTETRALPSTAAVGDTVTSPAIDKGDDARCPNNDQRGSLRPDDGDLDGTYACDIGAFELFIPRTDLHINNLVVADVIDKGDSFTATVEIHNDDGNSPAPGVTLTATLDTTTGMSIVNATPSAGSCTVTSTDQLDCTIGDMAVGDTATVVIDLTANEQGTFGLTTTVDQTGDPALVDTVPGNNTTSASVYVLGNSDMAVSGGPANTSVDQGTELTLDYTVVNNGEDEASNVRLGMFMPTGTSFVSATPSVGNCVQSEGEIACHLGTMIAADTQTVQIVLSADTAGEVIPEVYVAADQNDPDTSNNETETTVTVIPNAELALSVDAVDQVDRLQQFTVTASVLNNGPQDASNVVVTINLPAEASFVSSDDCTATDAVLTCNLATLANAATANFSVILNAETAGTASITSSVTADENDKVSSNNSVTTDVVIVPSADLAVSMGTGTSTTQILVGADLAATVTLTNNGPDDAENIVARVTLPSQISFTSSSACTSSGAIVTCNIDALAAGASTTLRVNASAVASGTAEVSGTVTSDTSDPDTSNNDGMVAFTILIPAPPSGSGSSGGGGGGCAVNPAGDFDPTLPLLAIAGLVAMGLRRYRLS